MKVINDALLDKVAELYKQNRTAKQISEITGLSLDRVYKYLKLRGIDKKSEKAKKKTLIEDLLYEGYSQAEIARILNIPSATVNVIVYRIRQKEKEPIRDAAEVIVNHVDDPVYYIEHKVTNEIYTYKGKRYKDVSALWLGG